LDLQRGVVLLKAVVARLENVLHVLKAVFHVLRIRDSLDGVEEEFELLLNNTILDVDEFLILLQQPDVVCKPVVLAQRSL